MSIQERVCRVLVNGIGLGPEETVPGASLKSDLGIDSTEMVEVIVALEKEFGMKVPDGVIDGSSTVNDIINHFSRTLQ